MDKHPIKDWGGGGGGIRLVISCYGSQYKFSRYGPLGTTQKLPFPLPSSAKLTSMIQSTKIGLTKVVFPVEVGDNNLSKSIGVNLQIVVQVSSLNRRSTAGRKQVSFNGQKHFDFLSC